jgi:hypothetical protein
MNFPSEVNYGKLNKEQKYVNRNDITGFEVLTAVVMKSTTFGDITLCSPLKVN